MKIAIAVAALITLSAGAANAAQMQGPWAEGRVGLDYSDPSAGLLYGVAGGYDFLVNKKYFVGAQAGISGSTISECFEGVCAKAGRDIEVLARGGGQIAENTTAYGLIGFANTRVAVPSLGFGANFNGFRIGAGAERRFGERTFGKVEYRYTSYENGAGSGSQLTASFGIRF